LNEPLEKVQSKQEVATPLDQTFFEKVWLTLSFPKRKGYMELCFLSVNAFFSKKKGLYGIVFSFR